MKTAIAPILLTAAGAVLAAHGQQPDGRKPANRANDLVREGNGPLIMWWGASSAVTRPSYQRIATAADWKSAWRRLAGESLPEAASDRLRPMVDFSKSVIVVIYAGTQLGRTAIVPELIDDAKDDVQRVRYHLALGPTRDQRQCTPYAIFLVPRSDQPLVLEEMDDKGAPHARAVFPKLVGAGPQR